MTLCYGKPLPVRPTFHCQLQLAGVDGLFLAFQTEQEGGLQSPVLSGTLPLPSQASLSCRSEWIRAHSTHGAFRTAENLLSPQLSRKWLCCNNSVRPGSLLALELAWRDQESVPSVLILQRPAKRSRFHDFTSAC